MLPVSRAIKTNRISGFEAMCFHLFGRDFQQRKAGNGLATFAR